MWKGLLKNVQDGVSRTLGSQEIDKNAWKVFFIHPFNQSLYMDAVTSGAKPVHNLCSFIITIRSTDGSNYDVGGDIFRHDLNILIHILIL